MIGPFGPLQSPLNRARWLQIGRSTWIGTFGPLQESFHHNRFFEIGRSAWVRCSDHPELLAIVAIRGGSRGPYPLIPFQRDFSLSITATHARSNGCCASRPAVCAAWWGCHWDPVVSDCICSHACCALVQLSPPALRWCTVIWRIFPLKYLSLSATSTNSRGFSSDQSTSSLYKP